MLWLVIINIVAVIIIIGMAIYLYLVYVDSKKTFTSVESKPKASMPVVDSSIPGRMFSSSNMLNTLYVGMQYKPADRTTATVLANLHNMKAVEQQQYCQSQQLKEDRDDFLKTIRNDTKWSSCKGTLAGMMLFLDMNPEDVDRLLDDIKPLIVDDMSAKPEDQRVNVSRLEALLERGRKAMCDSIPFIPTFSNSPLPAEITIGRSFVTDYTPLQLFLAKMNMYFNAGTKRMICGNQAPPPSFSSCGEVQTIVRGSYDDILSEITRVNPEFASSSSNVELSRYYTNMVGAIQDNVCASNVTVEKGRAQAFGMSIYNSGCFV